ncbi:hypothetical protein NUSPORA_00542 [Nucleospora cyclopteri]
MVRNTEKAPDFQRKQRQDEQVELRRVRTEEMLKKKREGNEMNENISHSESRQKLNSTNIEEVHKGAYEFRLILSQESNPPIQEVINSRIIPRVVELLNPRHEIYQHGSPLRDEIRVECAWILTNICTGTHEQTAIAVENGTIPPLVEMLGESSDSVVDQAVWCLGNIAGDCESFRDQIIGLNALQITVEKIKIYSKKSIKIFRNLMWLLSNFNRGRTPAPRFEEMLISFKVFEEFCMFDDPEVVASCFWGISYIVDVDNGLTNQILQSMIIKRSHELLHSLHTQLIHKGTTRLAKICNQALSPIIRTIGNIVTGTDEQTQKILDFGLLEFFPDIFYKYESKRIPRIRKEICWTVANVTAGMPSQVQYIVDKGYVPLLIDAISSYELYVRREAIYALVHISLFSIENTAVLEMMANQNICLALKKCLDAASNYSEVQVQILDVVLNLLKAGEKIMKISGENPMIEIMVNCKLADTVEDLQDVRNKTVNLKAYNIIMEFFNGEDDGTY